MPSVNLTHSSRSLESRGRPFFSFPIRFAAGPFVTGLFLCLQFVPIAQAAEDQSAGIEFFENRIRPVLVEHCYRCHSEQVKQPKGELRVDTRESIRQGGESGHAVVPGDLDESLLLSALRYEDYEMPPAGKLAPSVIADFETWIQMGAPDPRDQATYEQPTEIDIESGREYWAFQPPQLVTVPKVEREDWAWTDVDRFIAAGHEANDLSPVADAEPAAWLRRVYFDLIGLPPTPAQVAAFEADDSPDAYADVVDQLLDSKQFGERWGRHWLDIVRYAESTGRTRNFPYPFAWRYRNYVIEAFNQDLPYDRFLTEQLAGDLLPAETEAERDRLSIATGVLAMGAYDLNERNTQLYRMEIVGDQLDMLGRAVMGLTLGCARCHDHKFDPIPTRDYYAMAGIFRSTDVLNGYTNRRKNNQYADEVLFAMLETEPPAPPQAEFETLQVTQRDVNQARKHVNELRARQRQLRQRRGQLDREEKAELASLKEEIERADEEARALRRRFNQSKRNRDGAKPIEGPYAMAVQDAKRVQDIAIHIGGDTKQLGEVVSRGFLQVLNSAGSSPTRLPKRQSGRIELADWLTSPTHPLTARVYVNRVWQHLFGRGLVRTVDNFGAMGERPSHPELLDFLAYRFVEEGWSTKRLIRELTLSHTYRLSSDYQSANSEIDGENQYLWRVPLRRLEAEAIRDAILRVSGQLKLKPPTASPILELPIRQLGNRSFEMRPSEWDHRSVYLPIVRSRVSNYLVTFDFPEPSDVKGTRDVTTVATQALFMMNSPFILHHSQLAAIRIANETSNNAEAIQQAYRLTLNREPTSDQATRAIQYVADTVEAFNRSRAEALADVVHSLMATSEFRYR